MNQQSTTRTGKRRGPAPTGKGVTVGTRLQPNLLNAIDTYRNMQDGTLSRAGAIRAIIAEYFRLHPLPPKG